MSKSYHLVCMAWLVCLPCFSLVGCTSNDRDVRITSNAPSTTETALAEEAPSAEATPATEDAEKAATDKKTRERKREQLARDLEMARLRLEKAELETQQTEARHTLAIEKAEKSLALAERDLRTYLEREIPAQMERAELNLQYAEDGFVEAKEELEQLELMYKDEEFADKTREIVLERGRRRLERSQRDLDIRRAEHATWLEEQIPIEKERRERAVVDERQALRRLGEDERLAGIDRHVGLISARGEIIRLEQELEDLHTEIEKAAKAEAEKSAPQDNPDTAHEESGE